MKTLLDQIPGLRKDNAMFIDTLYHYPRKEHGWNDTLDVIYKDLDTGEKHVHSFENPKMTVFFTRDGLENEFHKEYADFRNVLAVDLTYKDIEMEIARHIGDKYVDFIKENNRTRNRRANKEIHKHPDVYGSDYDINAWTRIQWKLNFDNDRRKPITKMYLDIEADVIGLDEFVKPGERPINAVTLVDEETRTSHTFLLRNEKNPQIEEFEKNVSKFVEEIEEEFVETYGELKYEIYMYDEIDEIKMIAHIFHIIHSLERDFLMIWNMDFDIPYILERIRVLGHDPEEICCHPDFARKQARYVMRDDVFEAVSRSHRFDVSSYTTYLDQMVVYAGLRKGSGEIGSLKLNAIGAKELGDKKIDFGESANFSTFPYDDYWNFVKYNIKDVLLQYGVEEKTKDIETLYLRVYDNATPYDKAFKQTKFIENRGYIEYYQQGLVIGNNINLDYTVPFGMPRGDKDEDSEYDGGLVADPVLNASNGLSIFGRRSKYSRVNVVDYDYKSMYPNIYIAMNISKSSMIGKITIDQDIRDVFEKINNIDDLSDSVPDSGTQFIEDYLTHHNNLLMSKWFNLPSVDELALEFKEELSL